MKEVTSGVFLVLINRSRYSAVYGGGSCKNGFPSRGHQRGSASAAAQTWLEKEISDFSPSKTNIRKYCPSKNKLICLLGHTINAIFDGLALYRRANVRPKTGAWHALGKPLTIYGTTHTLGNPVYYNI
jgi:hypothetical protein